MVYNALGSLGILQDVAMKITPGWPESAEVLVVRKEQVVPVSPKSHVPLSTRSSQAQSNEINERELGMLDDISNRMHSSLG